MPKKIIRLMLLSDFLICICTRAVSQSNATFTQQEVIYGRKDGMALTMSVLTPKEKNNGKGIIHVVSGGFFSTYDWIPQIILQSNELLSRGYTIFAVMHGSQPKYTVPEIIPDIQRAVRFIRYNAHTYRIDPDHIGITGGSAGGHLSLLIAVAEAKTDPAAKDPVDRVSSRVQAVACFFPPTDFVNYGREGENVLLNKTLLDKTNAHAAVDFKDWDTTTMQFVSINDLHKRTQIVKQVSPIYYITPDDPPVFIAHGDADRLVPLQQSETFINKLKEANIPCALRIKKGADHGWEGMEEDRKAFADWFDRYLK